jgi:hypothetical protein
MTHSFPVRVVDRRLARALFAATEAVVIGPLYQIGIRIFNTAASATVMLASFVPQALQRGSEKAMREWAPGELAASRVTIAKIKRELWSGLAPTNPCPDAIRPSGEPRALS